MFETFAIQAFSEHVSLLFLSVHFDDCDGAVANVRPKEMPFDLKILRTIGNSLVSCQKKYTIVVFKHATLDGRSESVRQLQTISKFKEHGSQWEKCLHSGAEDGILCFKRRQQNFRLEVRFSKNWASSECYNVSRGAW